mmetsp:Transcript_74499/g.151293  ORF Transcript_74499/g.151293 Transcript_74499/m.151293 type:complete len:83 (-) Transcript_74499:128-376(-)
MDHRNGLQIVHGACNVNPERCHQIDHCIVSIVDGTFVVIVPNVLCHQISFQNLSTFMKPRGYVLCAKTSWFLEKKNSVIAPV